MKQLSTLTKDAFKSVIDNFGFLLAVQLLGSLIPLGVVIVWGVFALFSEKAGDTTFGSDSGTILFGALFMIVMVFANSVYYAANVLAVRDAYEKKKRKKYGEYFKAAFGLMAKVTAVTIIMTALVIFGLIFLIIPGLLVAYYLMFALMVVVLEKKSIFGALSRSFNLVSQNFWPLLGKIIVFGICYLLVVIATNFIPLVNIVVSIFANMIAIMFIYVLYREVIEKEKHSAKK
ncbi:hypothetical protein KKH43_01630 [Patescibacteria group bacterium]|nr:hypothetical protein [Patescibacteria group bacterium]